MPVCTRIFLSGAPGRPETPQKRDARLKNEIGMNIGNYFPPPLICAHMVPHAALDVSVCILGTTCCGFLSSCKRCWIPSDAPVEMKHSGGNCFWIPFVLGPDLRIQC